MCQDFAPIQGVSDLFGTKSLIRFSYSFQTNHHPITITITCLSSETTTTTTTTVDVTTTAMLCQCQLAPPLLLCLLLQVIAVNRLEILWQRPNNEIPIGRLLRVSLALHEGPASFAAPHPPMLPLATNTILPPLEPTMAPNQVGRLPAILAIFATADKMRRFSSMFIPNRKNICAQQSADFRSALKAGGFPPLVPTHFLKTPHDLRNNAGPSSFASKAAKGVKPGTKISPRLKTSLLPSWNETWTKAEDWLPVPKGQEDILRWGLGTGFRAHYGYPFEVIVDVDEMASSHGASGSLRMERVNKWLASIKDACIPLPDTIEFVNSFGRVDKMVRIPPKKQVEKQATKPAKTSLPLPTKYSKNFQQSPKLSPIKRQSSSEFPIRDRKGKGKAKSLSDEDKEIKELINDTMSQIFGALKFENTSKGLDYVIN